MGIGNTMRGDDSFGYLVIEKLKRENVSFDLLYCGIQPENFLETIKNKKVDVLIVCDTINKSNSNEIIKIFTSDEIKEKTFSTHKIPLSFLEKYLKTKIIFIGFPTERIEFGKKPSRRCLKAVEKAVKIIKSFHKQKLTGSNFRYF